MFTMLRPALALAIVVALSASGPAHAGGEARTHDGFLLRLSAGGGYGQSSATDGVDEIKFKGGAGNANFAIGGIVGTNLALHATLWGWGISSPDIEVNGVTVGSLPNTNLFLSAVGVGITYYTASGIYLSPSVGGATGTLEIGGVEFTTDTGFAFDATIGKEWWVGDGWGIGVAGAFGYHKIPDPDTVDDWSGTNVDVRFTATMN